MFGISGRAKESRVTFGAERGIPNAVGRCGVAEATGAIPFAKAFLEVSREFLMVVVGMSAFSSRRLP